MIASVTREKIKLPVTANRANELTNDYARMQAFPLHLLTVFQATMRI